MFFNFWGFLGVTTLFSIKTNTMEMGIGFFGDLTFDRKTREYQKPADRLRDIVELVSLADDLGIDVVTMGEHHRVDYSIAAPEIMLAALSTVTDHIKLASGVNVVSSSDPVKLYQDFSMIDLLSNQRAEIIAGRGSFIESFPLFGYDLNDYNELFEEKLELLLELQKNETINWQGKFRAPLRDQSIYPLPERPISVWIAVGGTTSSVARAGRLGLPVIFGIIGGSPDQFKPLVQFYKEQYIEHGHDPSQMQIGVQVHLFVENVREDILKNYFPYYAYSMDKIGRERGWTGYTLDRFQSGMSPYGALFMGEPDEVTEKIIRTAEMFGLTRFVGQIDVGGPSHLQLMKTIELYGTRVIPAVREHFDQVDV